MPDNKLFTMQISTLDNSGPPNVAFLETVLGAFKAEGGKQEFMLTAQRYYQNENDIRDAKREYVDEMGNKQEALLLTNNKLAHPFLRKLVNQKVNYLLSKIWTVKSEDAVFLKVLNDFFGKAFHRLIKNVGKDAVINGIGWVQVYYDPNSKLRFKRIPSDQVIAFWRDTDHTVLNAILRFYDVINYSDKGEEKTITKIEYHTTEGVWHFIQDDDGLRVDPDKGYSGNYDSIPLDDDGTAVLDENGEAVRQQMVWTKIPFVAFKYNVDEIPLLQFIKSLTDNYDSITSSTGNSIQDIPNSTKVIKDYAGNTDERDAFNKNLATFNTIYVRGTGDVTTLTNPFDITTVDGHLNRLRKDAYDFANGVDMQEVNVGNKSGVAMKFIFSDLDMDTEDMANEFQLAFENLVWFIKEDALLNGIGDFTDSNFEIIFNKDININELETMDILEKAQAIDGISRETIISNVPFVTDAAEEIARFKKEQADETGSGDPNFDAEVAAALKAKLDGGATE